MDDELARRTKAAAAYKGIGLEELGEAVAGSYSTLNRWLKRERWRRHEREAFIQRLADETGVPYEFFTVDFARLSELRRVEQPEPGDPENMTLQEALQTTEWLAQHLRDQLSAQESDGSADDLPVIVPPAEDGGESDQASDP